MTPDDQTIADASLKETTDGHEQKICAECGQLLDPEEWTPSAASLENDVTVYLFCGEGCREEWQAD